MGDIFLVVFLRNMNWIFIILGCLALIKGEIRITHNNTIRGEVSRRLGVLLIISGIATYFVPLYFGVAILIISLGVAIFIGANSVNSKERQNHIEQ